jgi:uncharacterized hydrophobic protein (TIGR00271 family)
MIEFFDLKNGEEDKLKVLENVKSNVSFRGSNLWILACAILIASIGLNVNSNSAIIGAMLISPLMGPIVGAGFSLGMFDFELLRKSLKNILIATIVSLSVATLYFFISPFKETESELLARTSPNIYDVLIAFFGGLVGVIAITRVEKGNPIPGVAIATALMPPLCTAGYGLAIGNIKFFLGALFLYLINCVFICISTFLIVKYLKYPSVKQVDTKHEKLIRYSVTTLILLLILPSVYLAYALLNEKKFNQNVDEFIHKELAGQTIIYKNIKNSGSPKQIELAFLTKKFNKKEISELNNKLTLYQITDAKLIIKQDTTDIRNIVLNEMKGTNIRIDEKDIKIAELQKRIDANTYDNKAILGETRILFPEIENLSIANHTLYDHTDSLIELPVMVYQSKTELTEPLLKKLSLWLQEKLKKDEIVLLREKQKQEK